MYRLDEINPYESPAADAQFPSALPNAPRSAQWTTLLLIIAACFLCQAIQPRFAWYAVPIAATSYLLIFASSVIYGLAIWGAIAVGGRESDAASIELPAPGDRLLVGMALASAFWCFLELCRGVVYRLGVPIWLDGVLPAINLLGYGLLAWPLYRAGDDAYLTERWKMVLRGGRFALTALAAVGGFDLVTRIAMSVGLSAFVEWGMLVLPPTTLLCCLMAGVWIGSVAVMAYLDLSQKSAHAWSHYLGCLLVPALALCSVGGSLLLFFMMQVYL